MSSWLAAEALVDELGIEEAERRLQEQYAALGAEDEQQCKRVLGALGRVRQIKEART